MENIVIQMAILILAGVANILLLLCLAHTWKYWRQVKWYVVMLAVGNWLQIFFSLAVNMSYAYGANTNWVPSSCRAVVFMGSVGQNVSGMAVAAISLHTLLTTITGCQGNRLRHGLVLGLFVLLSLPVPISRIPMFDTFEAPHGEKICAETFFDENADQVAYYIGYGVSMVYFPVFVFLACGIAAALVFHSANRDGSKGDRSASDLVITGLLGVNILVCCVPVFTFDLYILSNDLFFDMQNAYDLHLGLIYLANCSLIISAVATVIFAYVHAFRNRGEGYVPPEGYSKGTGERQRLVN